MTPPAAVGHHPARRPGAPGARDAAVVLLHGGNVASWMWEPQVELLDDLDLWTPDLPGFGARAAEDWVSLDAAADDVAATLEALPAGRSAHLVGLSFGAIVALRVAARQPGLVASVVASGAVLDGVRGVAGAVGRAQLRVWDRPWYWHGQARAMGIPADAREVFVRSGLAIRRATEERIVDEVYRGCWPDGLESSGARVLAVAGSRDLRAARDALTTVARRVPDAVVRLAPGMHHQWSAEDPELFSAMIRSWVVDGVAHPGLVPPDSR
ncbi:alpha/beta fold hydrolase [Cellulosimicrobium sp. NPDC057127]|uniref:alpha/beta fold hydrolase n=1 Tax=Cellulosimicrobium sp. NPDC057127 TaxID=3346026 RepID=UPI003637A0E9